MRASTVALLALALVALPAAEAQAQTQQRVPKREGFWIAFGAGVGSNSDKAAAGARGGVAADLRLGGSVSQQVLVGGDLSGWARSQSGSTVSRANAVAAVYYYPSATSGFYLKGGVGAASASVSGSVTTGGSTTTVTTTSTGFGTTVGGGYEIQVGSNFFIAPSASLLFQTINSNTSSVFLLTVDLLWH